MIPSLLPASWRQKIAENPALARALPFVVFLLLTFVQGKIGEEGRYWIYFLKTIVGAWLLWEVRSLVTEMKWAISWEAVLAGIGVFALWVGLDQLAFTHWERKGATWNPFVAFENAPAMAWFFVVVRIAGSSIVVPPLEEIFYRSFIYRWIVNPDFQSASLRTFNVKAFLITSAIFGLAHTEWVAGILCGLVYQWLVIRKGRLGEAMTAHAITNFLLGIWIVWKGDWKFW